MKFCIRVADNRNHPNTDDVKANALFSKWSLLSPRQRGHLTLELLISAAHLDADGTSGESWRGGDRL